MPYMNRHLSRLIILVALIVAGFKAGQQTLISLAAAFLIEMLFVGWDRCALRKLAYPDTTVVSDVIIVITMWIGLFYFAAPNLTKLLPMAQLRDMFEQAGLTIKHLPGPDWARAAIYIVFADFVNYWAHRAAHNFRPWWEAHKIHHSATAFSILTRFRDHPVYLIFWHVFFAIPLIIMSNVEVALWVSIVSNIHQLIIHSDVRWSWGWFGRWIVVPPMVHRTHHSCQEEHFNTNYAFTFIIWDRLFGTYYKGPVVPDAVGLQGGELADASALTLAIAPFRPLFERFASRQG